MMIGKLRKFAPLQCFTCQATLGWTAPGEAKNIHRRARVYCERCRDRVMDTLTNRERQTLEVIVQMSAEGGEITFGRLAERLGCSRTRASDLVSKIRERGYGEDLDRVLGSIADQQQEHSDPEPEPMTQGFVAVPDGESQELTLEQALEHGVFVAGEDAPL